MEVCKSLNELYSDGACFFLPFHQNTVTAVRGPVETVVINNQRGRPLTCLPTLALFELAESLQTAGRAACPALRQRVQQEVLRRLFKHSQSESTDQRSAYMGARVSQEEELSLCGVDTARGAGERAELALE